MAVDLLMVFIWGIAAVLILLAAFKSGNWSAFGFLTVAGFVTFAYAMDFERIAEKATLRLRTRRWLLASVCGFTILLAAGGYALGSLGLDLHWNYER